MSASGDSSLDGLFPLEEGLDFLSKIWLAIEDRLERGVVPEGGVGCSLVGMEGLIAIGMVGAMDTVRLEGGGLGVGSERDEERISCLEHKRLALLCN